MTKAGLASVLALLLAGASLPACLSDRVTAAGGDDLLDCVIPAAALQRGDRIVAIRGLAFVADTVTVERGQVVTWVNCDPPGAEPHTATAVTGGWNSSLLRRGDSYSHAFDAAGVHDYLCLPHAGMRGAVIVR